MRAEAAKALRLPAFDRLLDTIADFLITQYLEEIETQPTGDDERHDGEGHA